jgi:hypothetical protein
MMCSMRRHAQIEGAGGLEPHDHVAWYGDGLDDLYRLGGAALAAGARRGEKLLFLAENPDPGRLQEIDELDRLIDAGQLELHPTAEVYGTGSWFNPEAQLATFQAVLAAALADGYRGMRVVADNTPFVSGDEDVYRRWLGWEQLTDHFQAQSAVTGICYFDRTGVSEERLADLAAVHPIRLAAGVDPAFTVFADGDALTVAGTLDRWSVDRFTRVLETVPDLGPLIVDVSGAEFVDHRALQALNGVAAPRRHVHIRGASESAASLLALLGIDTPHLHFE